MSTGHRGCDMAKIVQYAWLHKSENGYEISHHELPTEELNIRGMPWTRIFEALALDGWRVMSSSYVGQFLLCREVEDEPTHLVEKALTVLGNEENHE